LGSISSIHFGDTSINPLCTHRPMSNYFIKVAFLACFLAEFFLCMLNFYYLWEGQNQRPSSIERCSSDAAYWWYQILYRCKEYPQCLFPVSQVPPLLKSVDLTQVFDYSGWQKKWYYSHLKQGIIYLVTLNIQTPVNMSLNKFLF
jgi:hypothetical protein